MIRYGRYFRIGPNNTRIEYYPGENTRASARRSDPIGNRGPYAPLPPMPEEQEEEGEQDTNETPTQLQQ